jgi:hypothetical protein
MKTLLALLLVAACGGPTQQQLADTPTARTRPVAAEPPPASTSDRDRDGLKRSFDDIDATQRAYREATPATVAPPPGAGSGSGSAAPVKKGPAEEAPKQ